jgi:hypothetical protein
VLYIFLDTNILIRVVTQGKPGCEFRYFSQLNGQLALTSSQPDLGIRPMRLLLPEVVKLEFKKRCRTLPNEMGNSFGDLKTKLASLNPDWNELADVKLHLEKALAEKKVEKLESLKTANFVLETLLKAGDIQPIPFTPDIAFQAIRSRLSGECRTKPPSEGDQYILASLSDFFSKNPSEDHEFYFCSENHKDFALDYQSGSDQYQLHPFVTSNFPKKTQGFMHLAAMMKFMEAPKEIEPPTPEQVARAIARENAPYFTFPHGYGGGILGSTIAANTPLSARRIVERALCGRYPGAYVWPGDGVDMQLALGGDEIISIMMREISEAEPPILRAYFDYCQAAFKSKPSKRRMVFLVSPQRSYDALRSLVEKLRPESVEVGLPRCVEIMTLAGDAITGYIYQGVEWYPAAQD